MKHLSLQTIQMTLMCIVLSLVCEGCNAKSGKLGPSMFAPVDSVLKAELGDSISSVMLKPKTVLAQRLKVDKGTISIIKSQKLPKAEKSIISFLMATIEKNDTTTIAFGRFVPNVRYVFKSGKTLVFADIDFGLGEIQIKTEKGDIIKRFNIIDKKILEFSIVLFKEDDFLTHILKTK